MRIFCFTVAALLLLGLGQAHAANASADANAVIALELKLSGLLERGALDEYASHLAPDYMQTTADGELLSRDQSLSFWRARGPGLKLTPSQMQVRVYGDTAILIAHVAVSDGGPDDRITKTFVRINGNWFLAALHSSHIARRHDR